MRRFALASAAAVAAVFAASPAVSGITVLGNSLGRSCYEAARDNNGSLSALLGCDAALDAGTMSAHDVVATFVNRGIVKINANRHRDAIADFDRAIALNPNEPESYLNKASAIVRMGGDTQQAIALFSEALQRDTRKPEFAYFGRAIAHEVSGDVTSAYRDYQRARQANPKWEDPQRELTRFRVVRASGSI